MVNPKGCVEVPLGIFGGLNTEMSATDLPQGLSPDCSNVAFLPGSVFTRPPLARLDSVSGGAQIVYADSFTKNDGTVVRLIFDANGGIWANGVKVSTTAPGNRFKTCSAFGRKFIATSDGVHGADVPLQYTKEGWIDRVSQDGPGGGVSLANYPIPQASLVAGVAGAGITIATATPINPQQVQVGDDLPDPNSGYQPPRFETYYTSLQVVTASAHGLAAGQLVAVAGNSLYNYASAVVDSVVNPTTFSLDFFGLANTTGTGGTVTPQAPLLSRTGNTVTGETASAHNFRVGYQVKISGLPPLVVGGGISSIVIDNVNDPNVATVTTSAPHGLTPENTVSITGVANVAAGTITYITNSYGAATITTSSAHGLSAGSFVSISGVAAPGYENGIFAVDTIISPTMFSITTTNTGSYQSNTDTGSVQLIWPSNAVQTQNTNPNIFTVSSAPTPTTFKIPISYGTGTWTTGTVSIAWNGQFYVTGVPSATAFQYRHVGPDAVVASGTGTVTPQSQVSPGQRQCVCIFRTRTGYLTAPSPTVTYTAAGQQYLLVTDIPIGPANVVARILAFTGANGGNFFYLPVAPALNGQVIGTSTVVNDNTTTSAIFDFSDQALFAAAAIDIPGNNLFRQEVLGSALGFYAYAGRMFAWGERNKVQAFWNMGFEGGIQASAPNVPLGWTVAGTGALTAGDYGLAWTPNAGATISQSAYQDRYGVTILKPNTQYAFRAWTAHDVTAILSSASTGFTAAATVTASSAFGQVNFSQATPAVLPNDLTLTLSSSGSYAMDELEVVYASNPYLTSARVSYINNPEAFDGVTGVFGPAVDLNPIVTMFERRGVLNFLTSGPNGSLYESQDTASGEPATWMVNHVAADCGAISVWGDAQFEDWQVWASDTGLRIYDGGTVEKMSQEIQPWWDTINSGAKQFTIVANDPYRRRVYVLACTGTATAANGCYVLDYRELNTSAALATSSPLKISFSGKMLTTDLTRKWSPWSLTMNYCGLMQVGSVSEMVFCNGTASGNLSTGSFGAIYTLTDGSLQGIDADYGAFPSYYTTYFMLSQDECQQRELGIHRKLYCYASGSLSGVGSVTLTPLMNRLTNAWRTSKAVPLSATPNYDLQFALDASGDRAAFRIAAVPLTGQTASGFQLSSFAVGMVDHPTSPTRGAN